MGLYPESIKKFTSSVLSTFLLSYTIILLIPVILGSTIYTKTLQIIASKDNNYKASILSNLRDTIDLRLLEIQRISMQIAMNPAIQEFASLTDSSDEITKYKVTQVIKNLRPYLNTCDFIRDFYIYYKNTDTIITPGSAYQPAFFYNNIYSYKNMTYSEWHETMLAVGHNNHFYSSAEINQGKWNKRMLTYIQSIPLGIFDNPSAQLVILIDEDKIKSMLDNIPEDGLSYIIDKDERIIVISGKVGYILLPKYNELANEFSQINNNSRYSDSVISYTTSSQTGWKYVSLVPKSIHMKETGYIKVIILLMVGAYFVVGFIIAAFAAYKNYSPIKLALDSISFWLGEPPRNNKNELEFIKDTVISAFTKNNQLEKDYQKIMVVNQEFKEKLKQNSSIVKNGILMRLIKWKLNSLETINGYMLQYGITFPHQQFCVLLVHIDDCSRFVRNYSYNEWNLVVFTISSVSMEVINKYCIGYITELEYDTLALIVNVPLQANPNRTKEDISNIAKDTIDVIKQEFNIVITISMGNLHTGLEGIHYSYREAAKAMEYKIFKGSNNVISFSNVLFKGERYYYPMDIELRLGNYLKAGDSIECEKLLDDIFEENFTKRKLSLELDKCLFLNIVSTSIKCLDELNVNYADIFSNDFDPLNGLNYCENVDEVVIHIKNIYREVCRYINSHRNDSSARFIKIALEYISKHYTDSALSQVLIAQDLGITPSYLSKIFKQESGQNMVDYINKFRIEKGKELLLNPQLCLQTISQRIGYTSDKTFIRSFKQYEGITPGQYRNSSSAQNQGNT